MANLKAERDELHGSLSQNAPLVQIDPAMLLQQLRSKQKTNATLKDVERLLDLLEAQDLSAPFWDWLAIDPKDVLKVVEAGRGGSEILIRDIEAIVNYIKKYALRKIPPRPMKQGELARRLGVSEAHLKNVKNSETFPEWSQGRDPHAVKWEYRKGTFYPL